MHFINLPFERGLFHQNAKHFLCGFGTFGDFLFAQFFYGFAFLGSAVLRRKTDLRGGQTFFIGGQSQHHVPAVAVGFFSSQRSFVPADFVFVDNGQQFRFCPEHHSRKTAALFVFRYAIRRSDVQLVRILRTRSIAFFQMVCPTRNRAGGIRRYKIDFRRTQSFAHQSFIGFFIR